jgi:hypothetical protein
MDNDFFLEGETHPNSSSLLGPKNRGTNLLRLGGLGICKVGKKKKAAKGNNGGNVANGGIGIR